ncbi:hypothetical protein HK096_007498, partial [Nowakowskiella sp. JEL0078]
TPFQLLKENGMPRLDEIENFDETKAFLAAVEDELTKEIAEEDDDDDYEDIEDEKNLETEPSDEKQENDNDDEDDDEEEEEEDEFSETFFERIAALSDALPVEYQLGAYNLGKGLVNTTWRIGSFLGQVGWVISTATALLILPAAFELEREHMMYLQEAQMRMPQQQAQQLYSEKITENN